MLFIESVKFDEIVGHHPQEIFLEKFNELLAIIQQTSDNTTWLSSTFSVKYNKYIWL